MSLQPHLPPKIFTADFFRVALFTPIRWRLGDTLPYAKMFTDCEVLGDRVRGVLSHLRVGMLHFNWEVTTLEKFGIKWELD